MNSDDIRRVIESSPVAKHVDAIMALTIPAVKMKTYLVEDDLPLGTSRMGGAPDLPPGAPWPESKGRPMEFLAQIDFAAAAAAYRLPDFPDSGWVALFRDLRAMEEGDYDDRRQWQWLQFDCPAEILVRNEQPLDVTERFNFCEIIFEPELCLPNDVQERFAAADPALEEEIYEYLDNTIWDIRNGPYHRLGGIPMLIQSDIDDYRGWEFLMQIDSDDEVGWMWGDMGRIYNWGKRKRPKDWAPAGDRSVPPLDRYFNALYAGDEFY